MFKNVGEKIKIYSMISFVLGIIASVSFAIVWCNFLDANFGILILLFLSFSLVGSSLSYISALFVYGFGTLIVNSEKTVSTQNYNNEKYHHETYTLNTDDFNKFE